MAELRHETAMSGLRALRANGARIHGSVPAETTTPVTHRGYVDVQRETGDWL